jgi:hypothetical protein
VNIEKIEKKPSPQNFSKKGGEEYFTSVAHFLTQRESKIMLAPLMEKMLKAKFNK